MASLFSLVHILNPLLSIKVPLKAAYKVHILNPLLSIQVPLKVAYSQSEGL